MAELTARPPREEDLDSAAAPAISTALPPGMSGQEGADLSHWLEDLRDRIIVRSQVAKRKLDAAMARRKLDRKLYEVGEAFLALVREGRMPVPQDVAGLVREARDLEEKLQEHHADIVALQSEA